MRIDIISLFPEMFTGPFNYSIVKRARTAGLVNIAVTNPRDFAQDKHKIVDDTPFGGGSGMVMKPEPLYHAIEFCKQQGPDKTPKIILTSPVGATFTQETAKQLAKYEHLIILCGHYEGIDARINEQLVDAAFSIGDYVLTGGELPAMVMVDAISRMLPGVLGAADAAIHDSFYQGLLEYPQYTRPREFNGWSVPEVLVSGDHAKIQRWRRKQSLFVTLKHRPELLTQLELTSLDKQLLAEIEAEGEAE